MRYRVNIFLVFLLLLMIFLCMQVLFLSFSKTSLLLPSILALILICPLAYLFSKMLLRPLKGITVMATQLATDVKFESAYPADELANLSRAIQEMANQLKEKIEEISKEKEYLQTGPCPPGRLPVAGRILRLPLEP